LFVIEDMMMEVKAILGMFISALALSGCVDKQLLGDGSEEVEGIVSVCVRYMDSTVKSGEDSLKATEEEMMINEVKILVFDRETEALAAVDEIKGIGDDCLFRLPVGQKIVCALVNGPDVGDVTSLKQLEAIVDSLPVTSFGTDGLTMFGKMECVVSGTSVPEVVTIDVQWLVSRVLLRRVTCNLPEQYGEMMLECVYLGNANVAQTLGGSESCMVNINGKEDYGQFRPIGKDGITGSCADYLFRNVAKKISIDSTMDEWYCMYCHPNRSSDYTCLYLLATIGDDQYYYRVPLDNGLEANSTCSVDVRITNLGSKTPPDGNLEKGDITAVLNIHGWTGGDEYVVEF